ncbi:unnamed protein product (macronuclear) [Paramecium tetraurelia]|uniref:RING-type domain-containing protein n=1 Tax=Paramecium tetraurelia TaxID=5888 RepID=A0D904_PARTE|nr:uncharacterized protein GSPATT00014467001 [Paramecium tetraurelia]CAK79521.1 unnamed protein product [Paramecium tetraurelia]|eukprot:XP_001446918.1 hypothetical protein (macronuclear) [Paramecium tetraurelia strain d4-2]
MKPNLQLEYESQAASSVTQVFPRILGEERENDYRDDHDEEDSPTHKAIIIIIALCIGLAVLGILSCLIRYFYLRHQQRKMAQVRQQSEAAYQQQNVQLESLCLQTQELAQCPICLMPIPILLQIITPCHHSFHKACLDLWLLNEKICPSCRTSLNL